MRWQCQKFHAVAVSTMMNITFTCCHHALHQGIDSRCCSELTHAAAFWQSCALINTQAHVALYAFLIPLHAVFPICQVPALQLHAVTAQ
jgi:hypothetical protein